MTYRHAWARVAAFVLGGSAIAAAALAVWQPSVLPFALFTCAFAWFGWLAWSFPLLRLDEDGVTVRNPFSTTTIPYRSVAGVTGGNHLAIEARGGLRIVAAAVPGRGNFTVAARRKRDAYGVFFMPVTTVDDLRIDAREPDTAATRIADIIRRRVQLATDATAHTPVRRLNGSTIGVTAAIVVLGIIGLVVR